MQLPPAEQCALHNTILTTIKLNSTLTGVKNPQLLQQLTHTPVIY